MPVTDGPILPLIPGQATVRVQDIDTTALTEDALIAVNAAGTRLEDGPSETIVTTSDNVVAQLEGKTGNNRLDAAVALRDIPGLTLNGNPLLFQINNQADVSGSLITGLPGTITAFQMFHVDVGGTAFGLTVVAGDLLIALVNSPSLSTSVLTDWFVLSETSTADRSALTREQALFLQQATRTGQRFDMSAGVFVNAANVRASAVMATGVPLQLSYDASTTSPDQDPARVSVFSNQALQLSNIAGTGGSLQIAVQLLPVTFSGNPPILQTLAIEFGGSTFTFQLNVSGDSEVVLQPTILVPPADYSAAKAVNANITLSYQFSGVHFSGTATILALIFRETGTLHDAVQEIAVSEAGNVLNQITPRLDALERNVPGSGGESSVPRFLERISPLINVSSEEVDAEEAYFSNSQPGKLGDMTRVDPNHNTFTAAGTTVYVAVPAQDGHDHILRNLNTSAEQTLTPAGALADPKLSVVASFNSIFVYEVTGLGAGNDLEVVLNSISSVVKWPYDINNLSGAIDTLRQQFDDRPLSLLPENVVSWLLAIVLAEAQSTTLTPSLKNVELSGDGTQFALLETVPGGAFGQVLSSQEIDDVSGVLRGRKIAYVPGVLASANIDVIDAVNGPGSLTTPLISRRGDNYVMHQFIAGHGTGSRVVTRYPAPATRVSGANIWQDLPTTTQGANGLPVPTADEVFFTRIIPPSARTLTIRYRGIANGNVFGVNQTTLANVGDPNTDQTTRFILDDGSETATVDVTWRHSERDIRVSVTERVNTGFPTISSVQVILAWDETVDTPAQADSTREIVVAPYVAGQFQPFLFAPSDDLAVRADSDSKTLWVATQQGVWNTEWLMNTLFSNSDGGNFTITTPVVVGALAEFFDFDKRVLTQDLAQQVFNIRANPYFGLFLTSHQSDTIATFNSSLAFTRHVETEGGTTRNLVAADLNTVIRLTSSGTVAVNIPTNASLALPIGFKVSVIADGSGTFTIDAASTVTLNRDQNGNFNVTGWVDLTKIGTDEWWAVGQGALSV